MKRIATRLFLAAAVVAAATSVASAQAMKAEIPFSFRFGGEVHPAGSYSFDVQNGSTRVALRNYDTRRGGLQLALYLGDAPKEWRANGKPALAFECGLGRCQLIQVWSGAEQPALNFPRPRIGRDEVATLRAIHPSRVSGD